MRREGGDQDPGQDEAGPEDAAPAVSRDLEHGAAAPRQHHPAVRGGGDAGEAAPRHGVRRWRRALHEDLQRGPAAGGRRQGDLCADRRRRRSHGEWG